MMDTMKGIDPCPVCGWGVIDEQHIPENPDPSNPPNTCGTLYIHRITSVGNGTLRTEGCSEYKNGETDPWEPDDSTETEGLSDATAETGGNTER